MRRYSPVLCLAMVLSLIAVAGTIEAGLYDWHFSTVDSTRNVGHHMSVAVDAPRDVFFVAYYDSVNFDLRMARKVPGGPWEYYLVDSGGDVGQYNSIDVRSGLCGSELAISYYDATNGALKVAYGYCDEEGCDAFSPQTIDAGNPASGYYKGLHTSLKIDSNGAVHVAYQYLGNASNESQLYAKKLTTPSGNCGPANYWKCSALLSYEGAGQYAALDLDATNNPTVASYYLASGTGYPTVMTYVGSGGTCGPSNSWLCRSTYISGWDMGRYLSLYVEDDGTPHLAFYDATHHTLVYAYPDPAGSGSTCGAFDDPSKWQCDVIEEIGNSGVVDRMGIAITGDGPGDPIIAYEFIPADDGPSSLKVARPYHLTDGSVGPNCGPIEMIYTWACEVVLTGANLDVQEADVVDVTTGSDGNPIIVFRELDYYFYPAKGTAKLVYHPRMDIFLDGFECGNTSAWSVTTP